MSLPKNLKTLRLGYSIVSSTFSSKGRRFSVGDLKPSHSFLQNQLLYRYITTSQISANQPEYTVNYLIKSCGLSPEDAIPASKWVKLRSPERPDSVVALLRNHGFSETQISKVVRSFPQVLRADPEKTLLPKLEYFRSLGVSREDLPRTLATNPRILWRSLEKGIKPPFNFIRSVLSEKHVIAVFKRCTWMFPNKNVVLNIGLLRELGMSQSCISLFVCHFNRVVILTPKRLDQVVREVKEMGFNLEKSVSVSAIVALSFKNSKAVMNRSRQVYMSRWGWSEDDVLSAFRKFPQCMIMSEKKIMQVMDCLVKKMGWPSGMVAKNPVVMGFSLEKRIIPSLVSSEVWANQEQNSTVNYLINSCGLSAEGAISASKWFKLKSPERADSVLACFRNHGFSETQISMVVRSRPQFLTAHFEKTLLPKLQYFSSLGVSREDLAKAVASNPALLVASLEKQIIPALKFFKSMVSERTVIALLKKRSRIFSANYCKTVVPNIRLLSQLGMPESCISLLLTQFTQLVILKHERFAQLVQEVKEMGFNMENSTSLSALRALGFKNSKSILNRSRQVYRMRWGWSEDDILSAFRRRPQCMVVSVKRIMQVMDFLVNKMGWPSEMIAKHPVIWCYSLEKRIIPRCSVVKVLLLKGLIKENFSFSSALNSAEKRFVDKYVTKFVDQVPQLSSVYERKVDIWDV